MRAWLSNVLSAAGGLFVGFLLGYWNHGLTVRREADFRRRAFRDQIRAISLRFDDVNWMSFWKTYQASVPEVKDACVKIFEDIKFWRRHGFAACRDTYCGFNQSDLELPRPRTPAGMEDHMKANQKKIKESKALLRETLERLARYAR